VKTITKIKVKEIKTRVPIRVLRRQNLPRFGEATENEVNVTIPSRDFVYIEHPDDANAEDADDPALGNTLANFILKQQERSLGRANDIEGLLGSASLNEGAGAEGAAAPEAAEKDSGKYVPPSMRGGDARRGGSSFMDAKGGASDREGENTIRVSNLTKSVTEDDVRDLFSRFGRVMRISLPRVERKDDYGNTVKECRGFAYVAFYERSDAERAMEVLQGYGYDHLILKLEWAKPTSGKDGPPPGASSRFMSGYGQKLAQDTKEQVIYASNLTGNR
jgi:translation initiation factor 3 subunit G